MATTRLSDVIYGPMFVSTTIQRIAALSTLRNSPIVSADPQTAAIANAVGDEAEFRFWNDISGTSNVSTDDPAQNATPNKITMGKSKGRKIRRNAGWQSADLVAAVMAEDPLDVIAGLVGAWWVREENRILGLILNAMFANAGMQSNVLNVASEAGATTPVKMTGEVAANAFALLGDAGMNMAGFIMHSRVFWNLVAASVVTFATDPATGAPLMNTVRYMGLPVIVSDEMPRRAGTTSGFVYTTYIFGSGAIGYAEVTGDNGPKVPVEIDRAASAGNGEGVETVWYRRHWVMHPIGMSFSGTIAGPSPTDTELALATNYTRVWDPKLIRIVAVTTNG